MSSVSGSDSDDEKDYYDFQFAKASKKHSKGNDTAAEKILRSLLNRAKEQPKSYLQPGGDRHYNTTSLLLEVLLVQDKVPEALSLCRDATRDIENVLGAGNMLCQMLKEDENGILRTMGIDDEEESQEVRDVQPSRTETQVAGSTLESSVPRSLATSGTETSVIEKRPYYETMAIEPTPTVVYQESAAAVVAPTIETQEAQVQPETETMAMEPVSTVHTQETEAVLPVPQTPIIPQLELETMLLADPTETSDIHETIFDVAENPALLSPVDEGNKVSRSASLLRKRAEEATRKDPQTMVEQDGRVWPPWDEARALNITLLGDHDTGKTMLRRLLLRIPGSAFEDNYVPTPPEDWVHTGILDDGENYPSVKIMEVADLALSAGDATSPRLDSEQLLRRMAISKTDVYCLCFSVGSMESYRSIEMKWIAEIDRLEATRINFDPSKYGRNLMVVACKRDLGFGESNMLPTLTARYLRAQYFEVSSKTGDGINDLTKAIGRVGFQPIREIPKNLWTKIFFVGDPSVGKTYLINSLTGRPFNRTDYNNVEFAYNFTNIAFRSSKGDPIAMEVGDTSGSEGYDRLRPLGFPGTKIVCFCFEISNPDSFDNLEERWWPMIHHYLPGTKYILVGCQKDRRTDEKALSELSRYKQHPITPEQAEKFRRKLGAVEYIETSIYTGEGILDLKEALADLIRSLQSSNSQPLKKYSSVRNIFRRK